MFQYTNLLRIFCALFLVVTLESVSAEVRVATVNMERLLNKAPQAQDFKKELELERKKAQEGLEKVKKELTEIKSQLDSAKNDSATKLTLDFQRKKRAAERQAQDFEEELRTKFMLANRDLVKLLQKEINSYAKRNSIDLILDSSKSAHNPVMFVQKSTDITEDILSILEG